MTNPSIEKSLSQTPTHNYSTQTTPLEKTSANDKNTKWLIAIISIVALVTIILIFGFFFVFFFGVSSNQTIDAPLFQVCLAAPNSGGCINCVNEGQNGELCSQCEDYYRNRDISELLETGNDIFFSKYCSNEPCPTNIALSPSVTIDQPSFINKYGNEWNYFSYTLPGGGTIKGVAPVSHTFGTDSSTNSVLGNTIQFAFRETTSTGMVTIHVKLAYSEGMYHYYEDLPVLVDKEKGIYRLVEKASPQSFSYTDSFETNKCEEYFSPETITSISPGVCGTGMMFGHGMMVTCDFEGDEAVAEGACDEFIKNLTIN